MKSLRLCLLLLPLALVACNRNAARANEDFNASGNSFGQGNIGGGFADFGRGMSDGANATGDAISHTANQVGNAFKQ